MNWYARVSKSEARREKVEKQRMSYFRWKKRMREQFLGAYVFGLISDLEIVTPEQLSGRWKGSLSGILEKSRNGHLELKDSSAPRTSKCKTV